MGTPEVKAIDLEQLRQRRASGESLKALASEAGIPWQKLWVLLNDGDGSVRRSLSMAKSKDGNGDGGVAVAEAEVVFQGLAKAIERHLGGTVDEKRVREIVGETVSAIVPRPVRVDITDGRTVTIEGRVHQAFDAVLKCVNEGRTNILMVGPAGSGKTTLAKNLAHALDLPFGFISLSMGVTETHLFGRVLPQADGSWAYKASRFVEVYESGGVFLLDEIDAADPNVMVAINAALANGVFANPVSGQTHTRHPKCYILGAANTWGQGGDTQYVGRNQLCSTTLDRFTLATLYLDYDTALEWDIVKALLPFDAAESLVHWVHDLRGKITQNRLRRIASTRLVVHGAEAIKAGANLRDVQERYFLNWSADERAKVEG